MGGVVLTGQVFISHTADMAAFPAGRSFVRAALDGVVRAGMAPVDMDYFAAREGSPAEYCRRRVRECEIYVALVGFCYGSMVPDGGVSYTELEFLEAAAAGRPRLVFLLDDDSGLTDGLADADRGPVEAFRERLRRSGLITSGFATPDGLELRVYHALAQMAAHGTAGQGVRYPRAAITAPSLRGRTASPAGAAFLPRPRRRSVWGGTAALGIAAAVAILTAVPGDLPGYGLPPVLAGGATVSSATSVAVRPDGVAVVTAQGGDHSLMYYFAGRRGQWAATQIAGSGSVYSAPSVVVRGWGEVDVVTQGTDHSLTYYLNHSKQYQLTGAAPSGSWSLAEIGQPGTTYSAPSVAVRADDVAGVAAEGAGHSLRFYWTSPGVGWIPVRIGGAGSTYSAPSIAVGPDGQAFVITAEGRNHSVMLYSVVPGGRRTGKQIRGAGSAYSAPSIAVRGSGEVDIVMQGSGHSLWYYFANPGPSWFRVAGPGSTYSAPSIAVSSSGKAYITAQGKNHSLMCYTAVPNSGWVQAQMAGPGSAYSAPSVAVSPNGKVFVIAENKSHSLIGYSACRDRHPIRHGYAIPTRLASIHRPI